MPENGILLKAGWYQTIKISKTYETKDMTGGQSDFANGSTLKEKFYDVNLSNYVTSGQSINVKLKLTFESSTQNASWMHSDLLVNFYSEIDVIPMAKLCSTSKIVHNSSNYVMHEISQEFILDCNQFYMGFSCAKDGWSRVVYFKNVKIELEIPDYNTLII